MGSSGRSVYEPCRNIVSGKESDRSVKVNKKAGCASLSNVVQWTQILTYAYDRVYQENIFGKEAFYGRNSESGRVSYRFAVPFWVSEEWFKNSVLQWFEKRTEKKDLSSLYKSFLNGECERAAKILSENLMETISFYDYQELEMKCNEALRQIEDRKYEEPLRQEGYSDILKYGVAFYRKECMVKS